MCLPAAAIGLTASQAATIQVAASGVAALLGYRAQSQSVRAAQDAANANARAAASSAAGQYRAILLQQIGEEDRAAAEVDRIERDALRAEGTALLAGIESGAGGASLGDALQEFRASALTYGSAVSRNLSNRRSETAVALQAAGEQASNRIATYRPPYERPSLLGAGLTVAGGFLDAQRFLAPGTPSRSGIVIPPPLPRG